MKMRFSKPFAVTIAVAPLLLMAATASAATLKIAVIHSSELVQNSPQFAAAQAQMKQEFQHRKDTLEKKQKKLSEDIQAFQKNADVMTPDDRVKKQNELMTQRNDLKYQAAKFKRDFQQRDQQLSKNLMTKIKSVIDSVAKQGGYNLVLEDPVYADSSFDITDEVLAKLKAKK